MASGWEVVLVGGGLAIEGWRSGGKAIWLWMFPRGKVSLEWIEAEISCR